MTSNTTLDRENLKNVLHFRDNVYGTAEKVCLWKVDIHMCLCFSYLLDSGRSESLQIPVVRHAWMARIHESATSTTGRESGMGWYTFLLPPGTGGSSYSTNTHDVFHECVDDVQPVGGCCTG